jgi:hypothetical protein
MLLRGKNRLSHLRTPHVVALVRDTVEVVAIVAAGIWAFYVFAYENRIKPSLADPNVNVIASMQRLSSRNGLIAVGLHVELRNVGTVKAHFLGMAFNVFGRRIVAARPHVVLQREALSYDFDGFYRAQPKIPVYSYAYVTHLGNPSTGQDAEIDPGGAIENDRTFYVPQGRFDLLTLGIDAPFTKFDETIPTRLVVTPQGAAKIVTPFSSKMNEYNIEPVTSLDVR